jgi:hypothetical protein
MHRARGRGRADMGRGSPAGMLVFLVFFFPVSWVHLVFVFSSVFFRFFGLLSFSVFVFLI